MSDPNDDTEPGSFAWARKHQACDCPCQHCHGTPPPGRTWCGWCGTDPDQLDLFGGAA